jgi:hypothetical protein
MPSRYRPDQVVCSDPACQRRRRAAYHRRKLKGDPLYRAQCRDSQQQWREQHASYMRAYRQKPKQEPAKPDGASEIARLLEAVKNNVALDLTSCRARVWLTSTDQRVKNILATAKLILVEALPDER